MITQLNPPLPMRTPKGDGLAHFVVDYGPESDLLWVVFMTEDGACWAVPNPEVRLKSNWSMGRREPEGTADAPCTTPAEAEKVHRIFPASQS